MEVTERHLARRRILFSTCLWKKQYAPSRSKLERVENKSDVGKSGWKGAQVFVSYLNWYHL
jgi:hypothetical protein